MASISFKFFGTRISLSTRDIKNIIGAGQVVKELISGSRENKAIEAPCKVSTPTIFFSIIGPESKPTIIGVPGDKIILESDSVSKKLACKFEVDEKALVFFDSDKTLHIGTRIVIAQ